MNTHMFNKGDDMVLLELYYKSMSLLSKFFGGADGLICALIIFILVDLFFSILLSLIKGNTKTFINKKIICKKIAMFFIIGLSNIIDICLVDSISYLHTITILFYIVHEASSILKKSVKLDLPVPKPLLIYIEKLKSESNNQGN